LNLETVAKYVIVYTSTLNFSLARSNCCHFVAGFQTPA